MPTAVRDVPADAFDRDVLEASRTRPVVVDFWAAWCGPCRQLSPLLERVAGRYAGEVDVVKVDVDAAPDVARTYRIQGIPAVKAFRDGVVAAELVGLQPEPVLDRFFAGLLPTPAERLVAEAAGAPPADAERLLREALDVEPGSVAATVALARLLADDGRGDEARALLARVPREGEAARLLARLELSAEGAADVAALRAAAERGDPGAKVAMGRALAAAGDEAAALDVLLEAVREPAVREDARAAVLAVFAVLGDDSPLVRAARPRLAAALF